MWRKANQANQVNQVGLVSVCSKFQPPILSRSGLKVSGGGGVVGWGVMGCRVLVETHFRFQLKPKPCCVLSLHVIIPTCTSISPLGKIFLLLLLSFPCSIKAPAKLVCKET